MHTSKSLGIAVLASSLLVGAASSLAWAKKPGSDPPPTPERPVEYQIHWIPRPSDWTTKPTDVNQSGIVVGMTYEGMTEYGNVFHGFVFLTFAGGQQYFNLNDLVSADNFHGPLDGAVLSTASGISNSGWIVGNLDQQVGDQELQLAYLAPLGVDDEGVPAVSGLLVLPLDPSLYPTQRPEDVSENGTVVGWLFDTNSERHGFIWTPDDQVVILNGLWPTGIDKRGQTVVGRIPSEPNDADIFRYDIPTNTLEVLPGGTHRDMGRIDVATATDDQAICGTLRGKRSRFYPHLYNDHTGWQQLPSCATGFTEDINSAAQICGKLYADKKFDRNTGFVFDPDDGYWSVDDLVVGSADDLTLWYCGEVGVLGISDADETTGYGMVVGQHTLGFSSPQTGFVLIPTLAP